MFDERARVCVLIVDKPVVSVEVELVPCTEVTMELFDPIFSCGVLTPSGHMVKCFHDDHPDYDELRQVSAPPPPPPMPTCPWREIESPSPPPVAAGGGLGALPRGWRGGTAGVSVSPLQAPVFGRRALSARRHHRPLHQHHQANLQGPDQVHVPAATVQWTPLNEIK